MNKSKVAFAIVALSLCGSLAACGDDVPATPDVFDSAAPSVYPTVSQSASAKPKKSVKAQLSPSAEPDEVDGSPSAEPCFDPAQRWCVDE